MRADRLLSLLLMLEGRGRPITAEVLARELEVSVRTIYRDLEALGAAGFPVYAQSGPGGGCRLVDGYRSPSRGLTREEAESLLLLGVPEPFRQLGFGPPGPRKYGAVPERVHLDMPAWFRSAEAVPFLPSVAQAVRAERRISIRYRRGDGSAVRRAIDPLGLVNKAGIWYVVAGGDREPAVYRVGRIQSVTVRDEPFERPPDFDLRAFWATWSNDFAASRPRLAVTVRVSPEALAALGEVFGDAVAKNLAAAGPEDADGWRTLELEFEHERAAAHRLAGFGDTVEVLDPVTVRDAVVETAASTLRRYGRPD